MDDLIKEMFKNSGKYEVTVYDYENSIYKQQDYKLELDKPQQIFIKDALLNKPIYLLLQNNNTIVIMYEADAPEGTKCVCIKSIS